MPGAAGCVCRAWFAGERGGRDLSLINQMLKDLEKRSPSGAPGGQGLPSGVVSAAGPGRRRRVPWPWLLLVLPALVGIAWSVRFFGSGPVAEPAGKVLTAPPPAGEPAAVAVPAKVRPAAAEQVSVREESGREESGPARLEPLPPERQAGPPLVVADPAPAVDAPKPAVDLPPSSPAGGHAPAEGLVRQEVQPTPRERADNLFRDGLATLRQGRPQQAETALRTALAIEPAHTGARDLLLRVLMRQNRQAEIRDLLAEGVRDVPHHLPYRIHFARLLVEEGALEQARQELTRDPRPAIAEAPDLYAMLATVHQRRGDYAEAARTYRLLLAVRPEQAVWWMGLGIALEGADSYNQAEQAYRQALSRGGLSAGLQAYVRGRLAVLEGRKTQQPAAGTKAGWEQS
jgi:MSHA biogenesis protein MshN